MLTSPLRVFGLILMLTLVSPVWAAPIVRDNPCAVKKCAPLAPMSRQAINCICGGKNILVFLVSDRPARFALRPGEQVVPLQMNSRVLGTGSRYLITSDPSLAAQLRQGFKVSAITSNPGWVKMTIPLVR